MGYAEQSEGKSVTTWKLMICMIVILYFINLSTKKTFIEFKILFKYFCLIMIFVYFFVGHDEKKKSMFLE